MVLINVRVPKDYIGIYTISKDLYELKITSTISMDLVDSDIPPHEVTKIGPKPKKSFG